jgi:hypothetical protein
VTVVSFGGFTFNEAGFDSAFRSQDGLVADHLERMGEALAVAADESIIEATPFYPHEGFPFSVSGELKATIGHIKGEDEEGVFVGVGSSARSRGFNYPRALETGEASIYGTRFPWISAAAINMGLDYRPLI